MIRFSILKWIVVVNDSLWYENIVTSEMILIHVLCSHRLICLSLDKHLILINSINIFIVSYVHMDYDIRLHLAIRYTTHRIKVNLFRWSVWRRYYTHLYICTFAFPMNVINLLIDLVDLLIETCYLVVN